MAIINELLKQITDSALRKRLEEEYIRINKKRKFGIVFEDHVPECTPLYGIPIKKGVRVAKREEKITKTYVVLKVADDKATCFDYEEAKAVTLPVKELVTVSQFGEPIFPTLDLQDYIENDKNNELWHTIIEADNYHALQLLEYLYPKKVDCIYIDPPYNTGARDWKYNNDYVDSADNWRHSKWLSMMQRRLKLARKILNPETGVMIVTIDEHELHHLRTLIEQLFPEAYIQVVTIVINPKGVSQGKFARVEENAIYVFMPNAKLSSWNDSMLVENHASKKVRWAGLLRSGSDAQRKDVKSLFYPILIDPDKKKVIRAGKILPFEEHPNLSEKIDGYEAAWPIRTDNTEGRWMTSASTLNRLIDIGYVALGGYDKKRKTWAIKYLSEKSRKQIDSGEIIITGRDPVTNVVEVEYIGEKNQEIRTVWNRSLHNAGSHGSDLLTNILGKSRGFTYPKSLYSERDAIGTVVKDNPQALIVDFFAGSGTTLHAVNLLNAEDNGNRRCILVTNNEVSEDESKTLKAEGYRPGDDEWEKYGICKAVTWPRVRNSILGTREDGSVISGNYYMRSKVEKMFKRVFHHIDYIIDSQIDNVKVKKQLVSTICSVPRSLLKKLNNESTVSKDLKELYKKMIIPSALIKDNMGYFLSEDYNVSILFDAKLANEWLDSLEDANHISDFYIVTENKKTFKAIKQSVEELLGDIISEEPEMRPMSEGFEANVNYFKLNFLDRNSVSLGHQLNSIVPLLWLKAGAKGKCIVEKLNEENGYAIFEKNGLAILIDETRFFNFESEIQKKNHIDYVYIVTNSEEAFREMSIRFPEKVCYQLYRDYIDNFVLGERML